MKQGNIKFETGLVEMSVNDVRTIQFNPSDVGFAQDLYGLASKLGNIQKEKAAEFEAVKDDTAAYFDISKAEDQEMRRAVDDFFGEGFCAAVFPGIRLYAMADGLTVIENFLYAVMDKMDDDITANMAKRNERIAKYTAKYKEYQKK